MITHAIHSIVLSARPLYSPFHQPLTTWVFKRNINIKPGLCPLAIQMKFYSLRWLHPQKCWPIKKERHAVIFCVIQVWVESKNWHWTFYVFPSICSRRRYSHSPDDNKATIKHRQEEETNADIKAVWLLKLFWSKKKMACKQTDSVHAKGKQSSESRSSGNIYRLKK